MAPHQWDDGNLHVHDRLKSKINKDQKKCKVQRNRLTVQVQDIEDLYELFGKFSAIQSTETHRWDTIHRKWDQEVHESIMK